MTNPGDFTEFMGHSWARLYRTAMLLTGNHARAEDLAQEALARTYAKWSGLRDFEAAGAYAYRTLVNASISQVRRRAWTAEISTANPPDKSAHEAPSSGVDLMAALADLAPRQRACVVLRYFLELPVSETAALLGCSEGTVKSQTSDALGRLRILLASELSTSEGSPR